MDLLIKNVHVTDDAPAQDIGIRGERIAAIGTGLDAESARTIDAAGRAVLPAFIEPHLHLEKAFLHRRMPAREGTLEEAIRLTGIMKAKQERADVMERSRRVLDMAVRNGTTLVRAHPDVDPIQGLIGVETALALREEYAPLLDLQVVAFPQEGIVKAPGTMDLLEEAMRMGADVVGGCPYNEPSPEATDEHVDAVFALAERYGAPIDLHADFADEATDPRFAIAGSVARKAIERGYQGRVALGHVTSLGALEPEAAAPVFELLARAGVSIITLPATDLYLGGRKDRRNQRRGIAPVRALASAGVNVAFSSNNIRNAFTPFGKADPLQIGNLLAHVAQCGTAEQQAYVLQMATANAARAVGVAERYGLEVGKQADLVIVDTERVDDALLDLPVRRWVIKRGRVTVENRLSSEIFRN